MAKTQRRVQLANASASPVWDEPSLGRGEAMMTLRFLLLWCLMWMLALRLGLLTERGHPQTHTHNGGRGESSY